MRSPQATRTGIALAERLAPIAPCLLAPLRVHGRELPPVQWTWFPSDGRGEWCSPAQLAD